MMVQAIDKSKYPIFAIAEKEWPSHKADCSGYVRAVAADLGIPLTGLANALVDEWTTASGWIKLHNDDFVASQLAGQGYFVVAGKKEQPNGHVVVVVPGRSSHNDAMGYWGKLNSVGRENEGLGFAWIRSDLKDVSYFAMPMASIRALDTPSETGAGRR